MAAEWNNVHALQLRVTAPRSTFSQRSNVALQRGDGHSPSGGARLAFVPVETGQHRVGLNQVWLATPWTRRCCMAGHADHGGRLVHNGAVDAATRCARLLAQRMLQLCVASCLYSILSTLPPCHRQLPRDTPAVSSSALSLCRPVFCLATHCADALRSETGAVSRRTGKLHRVQRHKFEGRTMRRSTG